jgi:hypothetical protein
MAAVKFNRSGRGRNKQVLRYPLKMFTAGTDYLQIDMLDYVPVGQQKTRTDTFTQTETVIDANYDPENPGSIESEVTISNTYQSYTRNPSEGFRRNGSKQPLGTILLPIPSNIQDGNSVNYTDDSMNSIVGAALGATEGLMTGMGAVASKNPFDLKGYGAVAGEQLKGAATATGLNLDNAQDLATKYLTAQALGIFGGNVSIGQLLAREGGQVFNPNMELLFNGPSLRNFNFTFKIMPRSADEAEEVKQIIRFFKKGMSAKAGAGGLFLKTPNVFELRYRKGTGEHPFLNKFKQCFLENISVNYTGDGVYATYEGGEPVSMEMTLAFKELAPIYDVDYDVEGQGGVGY